MAHFYERDATLRYNIVVELIRNRSQLDCPEMIAAATDIYEFVTRTGNSPARKKVDDEIPF